MAETIRENGFSDNPDVRYFLNAAKSLQKSQTLHAMRAEFRR
jgi:hypothetical protein